ncbi:P2Y purinoceptor 1-like isoform 1-T4 [Pholidichthys leucotaenia]
MKNTSSASVQSEYRALFLLFSCSVLLHKLFSATESRMNTTSACSQLNKAYEYRVLPALYIFVFIVGLGANGWALKSLQHKWNKVGTTNIFLLNLGVFNILFLPVLPFLSAYYFMESKWIFGNAFCKTTRFCFNLNLYGSIGFLTCISVYRYLAIVHPMRVNGRITVTLSVAISVMVWLLVSVQSLPDMIFSKQFKNKTGKCYHTTSTANLEDYLKWSVGRTLTGFCVPFVITVGCYGHMTAVLCCKDTIDKAVKQRCLKLLFILILLFSVCYTPYNVFMNLSLYSRILKTSKKCPVWDRGVYSADQISRGLVCLNSILNPLVYLHVMDVPAGLRQLVQQTRQRLNHLFLLTPGQIPVAQTADEL